MKKVKVTVEEHYTKEIEVGIPDLICENPNERIILAEDIVKGMYDSGNIVMDKCDYNGNTLISSEDVETGICNDWIQYVTTDTIKRTRDEKTDIEITDLCNFIEKASKESVEKLLKKYNIEFRESENIECSSLLGFDDEIEECDLDSSIEKIKNDNFEDEEDEWDEIIRKIKED